MTRGDNSRIALDHLADEINVGFDRSDQVRGMYDDARIIVGKQLIEARKLVEMAGSKWGMWCEAHIKRSRTDIYRVMQIASAPDPKARLDEERRQRREEMERLRHRGDVPHVGNKEFRDWSRAELHQLDTFLAPTWSMSTADKDRYFAANEVRQVEAVVLMAIWIRHHRPDEWPWFVTETKCIYEEGKRAA